MIKKLSVIAVMSFLSSTAVFAVSAVGVSVEPYLGYGLIGSSTVSSGGVTVDTGKFTGVGVGARGALRFAEMIFVGVDGSFYPSFSYSPPSGTTVTSTADSGTKSYKVGLVGGVALPVLPLRFWVGWNILDRMSDNITIQGVSVDSSFKGMSFKVGAGFKPLPLVSVNVEYIMANYGTLDLTAGGLTTTTTGDFSFKHNLLLVSASVPLDL